MAESSGAIQTEEEVKIAYATIMDKIAQLTSVKGDVNALKFGIKDLQRALLVNPAACSIMLPEDIGEAVALIRIYTGKEVVQEQARKATTKKSAVQTKIDIDKISEISIDDF